VITIQVMLRDIPSSTRLADDDRPRTSLRSSKKSCEGRQPITDSLYNWTANRRLALLCGSVPRNAARLDPRVGFLAPLSVRHFPTALPALFSSFRTLIGQQYATVYGRAQNNIC
jgi:hypothetical protein